MAVIKHISVKGSNGGDALNYVLYKHNEMTGEMILDGRGNPIMRDEFYLDGINCEPYSFAAECKEVNDLYGKNQLPGDIKAHHFIISYDPKDGIEKRLTGPKAQQLSMEWAERCLPGFQILVCTHMDGSNESGNIHTHIMINSVRKYDTKPEDYGERNIDHLAGYKLNLTKNQLQFMKQKLMDICWREGLCQIDLISPAKNRITDKEYRIHLNGQDHFDNRVKMKGNETERTTFQTQKQYLRDTVMNVASRATSFDSFCMIMKEEYNITVKENRGRISYLHPDREKYITGRALGTAYEKESLIQIINDEIEAKVLVGNEDRNMDSFSTDTMEDCKKIFELHSDSLLVVQLQDCAKARSSASYANKVALTNVKVMAETILYVQQNGFNSLKDMENNMKKLDGMIDSLKRDRSIIKTKLKDLNEKSYYLGQYLGTKSVHNSFLKTSNKREFYEANAKKIEQYTVARDFLKGKYKDSKFPTMKELREQKNYIYGIEKKLKLQIEETVKQKSTLSNALKNAIIITQNGNHDITIGIQKRIEEKQR